MNINPKQSFCAWYVIPKAAYICRDVKCLKKARKSHRIDRDLECVISEEVYDAMEQELENNDE